MSIRLRLTLLYSAILTLTLFAFGGILYAAQSQYTLNLLKRDLVGGAQRIAIGILHAYTVAAQREPRPAPPFPGWQWEGLDDRRLRELRVRDSVCILDTEGTLIEHPTDQERTPLPLDDEGLQTLRNGDTWTEIASLEGERWLVHNQPVIAGDQVIAIVQVMRSLADRDRSLRALGGTLVAGSLGTVLVAFGIGWVLSGITLRPIQRITQTAQTIGTERDLARRVPYTGPNDEVGQLAATLNTMLDQLEDAYQRVARALEMQRRFVADVSHELRTPLTTIRGNLALLGRSPSIEQDEQDDILADLVEESERLIRLVNDLLTLARADARQQVRSKRVALPPLIHDTCAQARLLAPERTLECESQDEAVLADPDALRQVLLILLDNAFKHTAGPVRVSTQARGSQVAIVVRDAGPGMDAEVSAHIFDRFYRGRSRATPGFGLGLSIARSLVEAQGGTIAVESDVDRGSTFTVALPRPPTPGRAARSAPGDR